MSSTNTSDNAANAKKLGYIGRTPGTERDSNAWFTPSEYIESARDALGGQINLDPFSSTHANKVVKADQFYTETDDAFSQDWSLDANGSPRGNGSRTVFMNPPYSGKLCAEAVNRFIDEWEKGSFTAGVFLVNNATETKWFQRAFGSATAACFTHHRISFWNADGKKQSGNTRGQAFFYFGEDVEGFAEAFAKHGAIVRLTQQD